LRYQAGEKLLLITETTEDDESMNRTYSLPAQVTFDLVNLTHSLEISRHGFMRVLGRVVRPLAMVLGRHFGKNRLVRATVYGQVLTMPAEHALIPVIIHSPQHNRPLALTVAAIAQRMAKRPLAIIDVGANIGETLSVIEQHQPKISSYLCIEPDNDLAEVCRRNCTSGHSKAAAQVMQCFIGEDEGAFVRLEDDGRSNPHTKKLEGIPKDTVGYSRMVRLDTASKAFAEAHGGVDLIKIDTEGYDFSVLRSAANLLAAYKPALYFEWFPQLLIDLQEEVWAGFDYLQQAGYRHFVFFTSQGNFYCKASDVDKPFLLKLAHRTLNYTPREYYDVCASTDEGLREALVALCITS